MEFHLYSTELALALDIPGAWVDESLIEHDEDVATLAAELGIHPMSVVDFGLVPEDDEDLVDRLMVVVAQVPEGDLVLLTDAGDVLLRRVGGRYETPELDSMPSLAKRLPRSGAGDDPA